MSKRKRRALRAKRDERQMKELIEFNKKRGMSPLFTIATATVIKYRHLLDDEFRGINGTKG